MRRGSVPKPLARLKPLATDEQNRDMYGFMVRPQHLESYRKHVTIYKEEEAERSDCWDQFLSANSDNAPPFDPPLSAPKHRRGESSDFEDGDGEKGARNCWSQLRESLRSIEQASILKGRGVSNNASGEGRLHSNGRAGKESSSGVENGRNNSTGNQSEGAAHPSRGVQDKADSSSRSGEGSGEDSEDEFCDATDSAEVSDEVETTGASVAPQLELPWEEELRSLVRGGVPMALRGELWQVFVGTKTRRLYGHYNSLLTLLENGNENHSERRVSDADSPASYLVTKSGILEKWASQIEKDLPRTFPGHPALDEDGRNTLRRLLTAYARHNPSVGYCQAMNFHAGQVQPYLMKLADESFVPQAMNFLAGLLLLLMPEENAFWTLTGIIDDYFEGYYSEKMVEAQVDQLVFEDLVREKFPRLVSHLGNLGVQVAWISGPWFLTIFVNVLPWESVLRVWDVLLYEGNRCMLFRTGLALMEMNAAALSSTRDAGDAVAMLQSMANDTFDSSQLVLVACMGFQTVTESRLQELRDKRRPEVLAAMHERSIELHLWRNSNNTMAQKLPYLYRVHDSAGENLLIKKTLIVSEENGDTNSSNGLSHDNVGGGDAGAHDQPTNLRNPVSFEENSLGKALAESISPNHGDDDHQEADAREQVAWLKTELCRALEDRKAASARAEELEVALVEMVKEDNRRLLSAKVEQLEAEVSSLKQTLGDKQVQEEALLQVLLRVEQEQKVADDARRFAEEDSTAQRQAAEVFQEKYEKAADALAGMEKRAVMAESMLEATLSYQALGNNLSPNPSPGSHQKRPPEGPGGSPLQKAASAGVSMNGSNGSVTQDVDDFGSKQGIFNRSFGLNWRDRSKARSGNLTLPNRTVSEPSPDQVLEASSAASHPAGKQPAGTVDETTASEAVS